MAKVETTITLEGLCISTPKPMRGKAAHREGHHHAAGISREDFEERATYQAMFKPTLH